tara:strand:- start:181 stop:1269 length:1089 start_codon:yes stop_codon:yes gene_type:complete
MSNDIYLIGEVGYEITLANTIDKVNSTDKSKPLNVHVHSVGGSVYEGLAIYNYLKGLKQEVNTISDGLVASIASIFFLAGNKETRKVNSTDSFLIHLPTGGMQGNASDFEKTAKELRDIENKLASIYVNETNLTKEEALSLMKEDEMLDVNFLKDKGFVSEINEFKAVAKFNINNKNEMNETLTKEEANGLFAKFGEKLDAFVNSIGGKKEENTNKIVQDSTGKEINFPDIANDASLQKGDSATVDNKKAEGSYLMPKGETLVFFGGILDSISEPSEEDNSKKELEASNKKVEELQASLDISNTLNTEKDTEILEIKASFETVTNEFKELKNTFTSGNVPAEKKEGNKEKAGAENKRTFRNK